MQPVTTETSGVGPCNQTRRLEIGKRNTHNPGEMATMSTQPGSDASILRVPTPIEPDSPAIPEDLGNVFLSPMARYEPSSTGWYVRWNGCGAYIGTADRRKQSGLRGMGLMERLLMSRGKS